MHPVGGADRCWGVDDIRVQVAAPGSRRQIREVSCTLIPAEWEEKEEEKCKKKAKMGKATSHPLAGEEGDRPPANSPGFSAALSDPEDRGRCHSVVQ